MFFNHFLLAIALFLVVGGLIPVVSPRHFAGEAISQTIAEPRYHRVFQPLLARLRAGTKIPIRLPQEIPDAGNSPLYAALNEINPERYSIELAFAPDCHGATVCRFGEVSGEKKTPQTPALSGQKLTLTRGITGYFTPAVCGANCSDATLIWQQDGIRYTIALKAGRRESLQRMAESAIASSSKARSTGGTISANGIGPARLGMKYGQLKTLLGKNAQLAIRKNFQVDFDAIAVSQSGQIQYYILYPSAETFRDSDTLKILVTDNPNYHTEKGVSPGMSLARGEQIYGKATLYRNTANESREYIKFAHFPVTNIYFRPGTKTGESAGMYRPNRQEYQETARYREGTIIRSIEVISR
jgi:hypothetical protein